MSSTNRTRRSRRTAVAAAAALGTVALCGSLALPAQTAFAAGVKAGTLTVQAPASVGFAGQPVAFTETVTNTGTEATTYSLFLETTSEMGTPPHAITIDYKDPASGAWKSVALEFHLGSDAVTYDGMVSDIAVPAGRSATLDLRIGAPMGLPHQGATNGGFRSIGLRSALVVPGSWVGLAEQTESIRVDSPSTSLSTATATVVAGGAPLEFDAVLADPTPSDYVNLGNVLFADAHATVQVRGADGTWTTLPKVSGPDPDGLPGVYLQGRNSSIGAGQTTVTRVRVSYDGSTPPGQTELNPCLFVNEGDTPFRGTTLCSRGMSVTVTAPPSAIRPLSAAEPAASAGSAASAGPTHAAKPAAQAEPVTGNVPAAVAKPTASAPTVPAASGPVELAASGAATSAGSGVAPAATVGAVLLALGAGLALMGRRLRRRS